MSEVKVYQTRADNVMFKDGPSAFIIAEPKAVIDLGAVR